MHIDKIPPPSQYAINFRIALSEMVNLPVYPPLTTRLLNDLESVGVEIYKIEIDGKNPKRLFKVENFSIEKIPEATIEDGFKTDPFFRILNLPGGRYYEIDLKIPGYQSVEPNNIGIAYDLARFPEELKNTFLLLFLPQ